MLIFLYFIPLDYNFTSSKAVFMQVEAVSEVTTDRYAEITALVER